MRAYAALEGGPTFIFNSHDVEELPLSTLPDPQDLPVVRDATLSGATTIVTDNLSDFPNEQLKKLGLQSISPDQLLSTYASRQPEAIIDAAHFMIAKRQRPAWTKGTFCDRMRRSNCSSFADWSEAAL